MASSESNPPSQEPLSLPEQQKHQTDTSELFSSAKIVAEAAQATIRRDADYKMNKAEVADAAGDLLGAVSDYAKLGQTSYGKYVTQAQDYLHKQSTPAAAAAEPTKAQPEARDEGEEEKPEEGGGDILKMAQGFLKNSSESAADAGEGEGESGGVADYMKVAQGFLKNSSESSGGHGGGGEGKGESGGVADYMKMAGGFFNK